MREADFVPRRGGIVPEKSTSSIAHASRSPTFGNREFSKSDGISGRRDCNTRWLTAPFNLDGVARRSWSST